METLALWDWKSLTTSRIRKHFNFGERFPSSSQTIKLAVRGDFAGIVYAPNSDSEIKGNGSISGAAVGEDISITGDAALHYDLNLKNFNKDGSFGISR